MNMLNEQSQTSNNGWSSMKCLGFGKILLAWSKQWKRSTQWL